MTGPSRGDDGLIVIVEPFILAACGIAAGAAITACAWAAIWRHAMRRAHTRRN